MRSYYIMLMLSLYIIQDLTDGLGPFCLRLRVQTTKAMFVINYLKLANGCICGEWIYVEVSGEVLVLPRRVQIL